MDAQKITPWLVIGGLAVGAYLLFQSSGGSSTGSSLATVNPPDTSASDAARYGFLGTAVGELAQLEQAITADQYQYSAVVNSNNAAVASAQAQAEADKAAARASAAGKRGLDLGPIHLHW